jgi:uncharacterized membrane protein
MFFSRFSEYIDKLKKVDFYKVFTYFFLCALIGWIFETTAVFLDTGQLTDRGLLFVEKHFNAYFSFLNNVPYIRAIPLIWGLPIIEIYGIGGIIILFSMGKFKNKIGGLFLIGTVLMTLFELATSFFCDYILHQSFWDYSNQFMNFQGRICLRSSLIWGLLTVFSIKSLRPKLDKIYEKEKHLKIFKKITILVAVYTLSCILFKIFVFK